MKRKGLPGKQPHGYKKDPLVKRNKFGLTAKEENFCHCYLIKFNGSEAARLAGYSIDTAGSIASKLLTKSRIQARISLLRQQTGKDFNLTKESLLQQLMAIVYSNPKQLFDGQRLKDPEEWSDELAASIQAVEMDPLIGGVKKVTKADKLRAIEQLCKMLGFNAPDVVKNLNLNSEPLDRQRIVEVAKQLEDFL